MSKVQVQIIRTDKRNPLPEYKTKGAAGMDLYASLPNDVQQINIAPGEMTIIQSGIKVSIPEGYEIQLRARSGNAAKYSVTLANSVGTIDHGYLDAIGVMLINHGNKVFVVKQGDRIAQAVLAEVPVMEWLEMDEFDDGIFNRGGGLGSTGIQDSL
jgi:dUTP pyrophosphatase